MMKQIIWAIVRTKSGNGRYGDFYHKDEIVEVNLSRRLLKQILRKNEKIINYAVHIYEK